jgi:hypothetical protein
LLNEELAQQMLGDDQPEEVGESSSTTTKSGERRKRGAAMNSATTPASVWPNAIVPYIFAASLRKFRGSGNGKIAQLENRPVSGINGHKSSVN